MASTGQSCSMYPCLPSYQCILTTCVEPNVLGTHWIFSFICTDNNYYCQRCVHYVYVMKYCYVYVCKYCYVYVCKHCYVYVTKYCYVYVMKYCYVYVCKYCYVYVTKYCSFIHEWWVAMIVWSVQWLATSWMVWGSKPSGDQTITMLSVQPRCPPSFLYKQ